MWLYAAKPGKGNERSELDGSGSSALTFFQTSVGGSGLRQRPRCKMDGNRARWNMATGAAHHPR